jgi:predicted transposase YbfD/YdcC
MRNSILDEKNFPAFPLFFSQLTDPRRTTKGNFYYPLNEILFLVITAVVSGAQDWVTISIFGKSKLSWLRQYLPYKNGVPSHDVLGKVFALLDAQRFNECFIQWVNAISDFTNGEVVAIDGKTICGSSKQSKGRSAFHLVSAYATGNKLCLGQQCTADKSNEITAIPKLLEVLNLQGCVVTLDAMGCQREIAQKILDKKADYILTVKDNQQQLKQQIEKVFHIQHVQHAHQHLDAGHGRIEKRTCDVINQLDFLDERDNWPKLNSIIRIKSERYMKQTAKSTQEIRYYISSLCEDAIQFNNKIRQHWAIENNLHWVLDVIFDEDASLKKNGNSAINFSLINKMALALLDREKSTKMSKPSKRMKAALDDDYRSLILKT